jgi:uncharacterized damage-inducible protein DinB
MSSLDHVRMMAGYNEWMNARMYETAAKLSPEELSRDRGAFFGSIMGTLNHLVVGDVLWLKRFAAHPSRPAALEPIRALPQPAALNQILFTELPALAERRRSIDAAIKAWADGLKAEDLEHVLDYTNTRGVRSTKRFGSLLVHFFNHQTHHRGQASTLLFQAGQDIGATDLLVLIPNEG